MSGLRIAVVGSGDPAARSGVARNLAQLIAGLRELGHDVMRLLGEDRAPTGGDAADQAHARMGRQLADCRRAFQSWRPQVVHIEVAGGFGHAALQAAMVLGIPITAYWHRLHETAPPAQREQMLGLLLAFHQRLSRTFVDADDDASMLRERGVPGVVLAGRGVDTRLFAPDARRSELRRAWGAGDDDPVLLHVGRLIAVKNLGLVERAATAARAAAPTTRLVITGDGAELAGLRARLPWAICTGALGDDTLAEVYASADAFLFPSLVDTYGNVVLEAMASGLAVVSFDRGAAARHLRDGVDGRRIAVADESQFIAATVALARDPAGARRLGAAARQTAAGLSLAAAAQVLERELRAIARS